MLNFIIFLCRFKLLCNVKYQDNLEANLPENNQACSIIRLSSSLSVLTCRGSVTVHHVKLCRPGRLRSLPLFRRLSLHDARRSFHNRIHHVLQAAQRSNHVYSRTSLVYSRTRTKRTIRCHKAQERGSLVSYTGLLPLVESADRKAQHSTSFPMLTFEPLVTE